MNTAYASAKARNRNRHSAQHHRKMANARAAQERKRLESPPPPRPLAEPGRPHALLALMTWVNGRPYVRMMTLHDIGKARSFRIEASGRTLRWRDGSPVTSLSEAAELLRKRAVRDRRFVTAGEGE